VNPSSILGTPPFGDQVLLTLTPFLVYAIGQPVAFISGKNVFSRSGRFVGLLDGKEVWHGSYKGEIVKQNRFLYNTTKGSVIRGTPGIPGSPGIPGIPGSKVPLAFLVGIATLNWARMTKDRVPRVHGKSKELTEWLLEGLKRI